MIVEFTEILIGDAGLTVGSVLSAIRLGWRVGITVAAASSLIASVAKWTSYSKQIKSHIRCKGVIFKRHAWKWAQIVCYMISFQIKLKQMSWWKIVTNVRFYIWWWNPTNANHQSMVYTHKVKEGKKSLYEKLC